MLKFRSGSLVFMATVLILSVSIVFYGCQNNSQVIPVYNPISKTPLEVTIDQIYTEYMANETAADDKYYGERLLFYGVTVEEVGHLFNWGNNEVYFGITHFITDNIQFNPRYTVDLDNLNEGFVVDVVGECKGLKHSFFGDPILQIDDCWIKIIEGGPGVSFGEEYY